MKRLFDRTLRWYREFWRDFTLGWKFPLLSSNTKTGVSFNTLPGGRWHQDFLEYAIELCHERGLSDSKWAERHQAFYPVAVHLLDEYGPTVQGTCPEGFIDHCFGQDKGAHRKPNGPCYGLQMRFIDPRTFFGLWMRGLYFQREKQIAWEHLRSEIELLRYIGDVEENYPLRLNGVGDIMDGWPEWMREYLHPLQLEVTGFVRKPQTWLQLLELGFVQFALTVDHTTLRIPDAVRSIKEQAPWWGSVVWGPLTESRQYELLERSGLPCRVVFQRHFSNRVVKSAQKIVVPMVRQCPTYFDLEKNSILLSRGEINREEKELRDLAEVRRCFAKKNTFARCVKCHGVPPVVKDVVRTLSTDELLDWSVE